MVDTASGRVRAETFTEPCFAFHHINAYDDEDAVVVTRPRTTTPQRMRRPYGI